MDNWAIFEDRALSLLEWWRKFAEREEDSGKAIEGFLAEISDDFTKELSK